MKPFYFIIILFFFIHSVKAETFQNVQIGILLELPSNWKTVPVLESNKPSSILEAIRNNNSKDFLTLVVYPSIESEPSNTGKNKWGEEMSKALGNKKEGKIEVKSISDAIWYQFQTELNQSNVVIFYTIQNSYAYTFSFVVDLKSKPLLTEATNIIEKVTFSKPTSIIEVQKGFQDLQENNIFKIPQGFHFTNDINIKTVAPYAYSLYKNLLAQNLSDYVMIFDDYFNQLFCLNISKDLKKVDANTLTLIARISAKRFEQDGAVYKEISLSKWEKSPDSIFLHKFKLDKEGKKTVHYIFYIDGVEKTKVVKIQMAENLENELESFIYEMILKNVPQN